MTLAPASSRDVVQLGSKTLSSAQLLALDTTAVTLLPIPGGRNYYVVHGVVLHYRFVTTPYNENVRNDLVIALGATNADLATANTFQPLAASITTGDLFKATADTYVSIPATTTGPALGAYFVAATAFENKPLSIGLPFGASLTGGDSTLSVRTFYSIIDGS